MHISVTGLFDRAKEALDAKTNRELAQRIGVAESSISNWKAKDIIPMEYCAHIAAISGCSLDWLVLGRDDSNGKTVVSSSSEFVAIPRYNVAASAGSGSFFDSEHIINYLEFRKDWIQSEGLHLKDLACITVTGDSMYPTLQNSDVVLINLAKTEGDGIFVIRLGTNLHIKRLQWLATGELSIISDNKTIFATETIQPSTLDDNFFEIIGFCHARIGRVF